jgi:pyruvate/oxaloacetate carboxyltransferase
MNKPVKFNNTMRDSYQSNLGMQPSATEMTQAEKHMEQVGWHSVQGGGGTFFHVPMLRGRDPWEEQKIVREAYPVLPMSILVRGDVLVGYDVNPDDVIQAYVREMVNSGINGFTIFDGLNDTRNQEVPIRAVNQCRDEGAKVYAQGAICVGDTPAFDMNLYMDSAAKLAAMGVRDFYLKDPCGLVKPETVYELVSRLKEKYDKDVFLHVHNSHGLAYASYMAGIEAGADGIDVGHPGMGENVAQPSALKMMELIENHPSGSVSRRAPDLNLRALEADMESLMALRFRYRGTEPVFDREVYEALFQAKGPGGAASAIKAMFEGQFSARRIGWRQAQIDIYKRQAQILPRFGHPMQVTPHAKNTTTEATYDVLFGRAGGASSLTDAMSKYLTGQYGRVPGHPDPELVKKALEKEGLSEPMTVRPASMISPLMEASRQKLVDNGIKEPSTQDVLTVAMWWDKSQTGLNHVLKKHRGELTSAPAPALPSHLTDITNGNPDRYYKNGHKVRYEFEIAEAIGGAAALEAVAQDALEIEKREHLKNGGSVPAGQDRAGPEYFDEMFDKWGQEAQARIDAFLETVPEMLYDDGFDSGQLLHAVERVNRMIEDACKQKGVTAQNIPAVQQRVAYQLLDRVREGNYIGTSEPAGDHDLQPVGA